MTYLGYPDTTGLSAIDYRITDSQTDPPGLTSMYHTEKLIYMPEIQWCYQVPLSPRIKELPALEAGCITFGSLNNMAKINRDVIRLWSRILAQAPDSRILMVTGGGRDGDRRLLGEFERHGIVRSRVTLHNRMARERYFDLYDRVDICLDPFPFTGCATTCDSLWMGVPVITLAGRSCVSRQGVSILSHLDLQELIAETPDDYVQIAARLARDFGKLRNFRRTLRDRMRSSTLADARGSHGNLRRYIFVCGNLGVIPKASRRMQAHDRHTIPRLAER